MRAGSRSWRRQFKTSEGVAQAITYAGYVMVGVLVLFVIWSELRAAGLLGRRAARARRRTRRREWRRRLHARGCGAAPLADRPGMLLRLLGEALTRAQRLPAAEGLTRAAIARRAQLDSSRRTRRAARTSAPTADAVRFAATPPPDEQHRGNGDVTAKALLEKFARRGRQTLMRERGIAFLLALAALAAFYGLWLRPAPSLDPDADAARPTTAERRGNGYAGLYEWLQRSGCRGAFAVASAIAR